MGKRNVPKAPDIDLSNIKNIEAVEKIEPEFKKKVDKKTFMKRSKRFNFVEPETIPLPSKGLLYKDVTDDEDILNGYIKMYPMTAKEEEILSTPRFLKSGASTRMILERTIASSIDAKDILLFDSNFLMFYLRKISYGDDYTFTLTCENPVCGREFEHTVKISELEFEELPDDIKEPIEILLPKSKFTVKVILPRLYHSEEIVRKNLNRKKSTDSEDKRLIDNVIITTVEILDENKKPIEKKYWEEFFESLPGIDIAEIRQKTNFSTGIDRIENIECPYCETKFSGSIPIGPEFFRF